MAARDLIPYCEATLIAIAQSPGVVMFNVGRTMDFNRRRRQYLKYSRPRPWKHMVSLAQCLTEEEASKLEKALFDFVQSMDKRTKVRRKYSDVIKSHFRNSSGGRRKSEERIYCVYVAWMGR